MRSYDAAIVGGGAAGLATAIFAKRRAGSQSIVILDGAKKLGAKILVSGGGRCNVTNVIVTPTDYWGGSRHIIRRVLSAFTVEQTVAFFAGIGVALHEEEIGKLFPDTGRADTVLAALLAEADRLGIDILTEHRVTGLERRGDLFVCETSQLPIASRRLVLATGGRSLPKTGSDGGGYEFARRLGHSLVPTTPALAGLILDGDFHMPLSGVSHECELTLRINGAKPTVIAGSLLWTHFGISGPAAINVSRLWHRASLENREVVVSVNFLPGESFETLDRWVIDAAASNARTALHNVISLRLPDRVVQTLLQPLNIDPRIPVGHLRRDDRRKLIHALLSWPLAVRDSRGYRYAEATAGGITLDEIDSTTMASRKCPGLFLVGEILDVDGRIGGFNFQWAWSSAHVAAIGLTKPD